MVDFGQIVYQKRCKNCHGVFEHEENVFCSDKCGSEWLLNGMKSKRLEGIFSDLFGGL